MQIPLLAHLANASEALPMVVAAAARRPVRGARGWIVAGTVAHMAIALGELYLGLHGMSNLWFATCAAPIAPALFLWALSCFQVSELARLTVRLVLVAALVAWATLTLAFENTSTFSRAAEPMLSLVCVGVAASTLVLRSHASRASLFDQDWFWISAGVALFFASWSAVGPLSLLLVGGSPALFTNAYQVTEALNIVAMLAIARGMACPIET